MSLLYLLFVLTISSVATAALIKVLLSGKVFDVPRTWLFEKLQETSFLGKLIRCPYCLSFWFSAAFLALFVVTPKVWLVVSLWLTVQRLSNVFDDVTDRIYYSQYGPAGLSIEPKDLPKE